MNLFNMNSLYNNLNFRICIVAAILFFTNNVYSQDAPQGDPFQYNVTDKMFLPTPEQASLMKFIDIPAGNHTGVHGFSVPIHTIQGKDFSFPINLSYHGGGIKVDELSSSVGIGWALNIGGISLSEEIRGERDLGGIQRLNNIDPVTFLPEYGDPYDGGSDDFWLAVRMTGNGTVGLPGVPEAELQPDYFSYNLLNNSGSFMLDNNNKPHTIPKDDVVILTPQIQSPPLPTKQQLTDNKGIKYYFSSYIQDHAPGLASSSFTPRIRYSYKIDSIVIPNSGSVIFDYYEVSYKYISSRSKTKKVNFNTMIEEYTGISETESTITEHLPKSVTYKQTKVNFKYKMTGNLMTGREDVTVGGTGLYGNKGGVLEYIEVLNTNDIHNPLKNFRLINYFDNSRLRLKKVEDLIQGTDYVFDYVGEYENKFLPPRFSYQQDHWGMYNGKGNSGSVSEFFYKKGQELFQIRGANKDPDINFAKIGSLQKVKLPTGGSQEFEYELDEFRNVEFIDDPVAAPVHDYQEHELTIADYFFNFHAPEYEHKIINLPAHTPDYRAGLNIKLNFETSQQIYNPGNETPIDTYYQAELYDSNHQKIAGPVYNGSISVPALDPQKNYYIKFFKFNNGYTNPLPPTVSIKIGLEWIHDHVTNPQNRYAGTLRIKSISLKDSDGNPKIKKSYSYTDFDNTELYLSSGFYTGNRPFPWYYLSTEPNGDNGSRTYINIPDNGIQNLNSTFGKTVIYEKVTEIYESTDPTNISENYKKEYIFSIPDEYTKVSASPILAPPNENYKYGLLLEERWKNYQNKNVKVTRNKYYEPDNFFNQFSHNNYFGALSAVLAVANMGRDTNHPMEPFKFKANYSSIISAWIKLEESTTETFENGTMTMSQTQKYKYDDSNNEFKNIHPIETITYNSLGQELRTEYSYWHTYKKDEPTQIIRYENNLPTYIKQTTFSDGLPRYEYEKKASNVLTSEDLMLTYDRYDVDGNLQQYTMANGTPVSIIWGYNGQYPIAKVEGKFYSEIETFANTLIIDSNSHGLLPEYFNNLRNLEGALVTSYIYKPFVGVTSIIQPNGQTEHYIYDTAGRLEEVYIMEMENNVPVKRVLKKTKYNYQP